MAATNRVMQARTRIRNHLQTMGHEEVSVTSKMVDLWWKELNVAVFDDTLPYPVEIQIKERMPGAHAACTTCPFKNNVIIEISNYFESREKFLAVLVHEMVHQWEYVTYGTMAHNHNFYSWKKKIFSRTGLTLSRAV